MSEYKHGEAFCLMKYASRDGRVVEMLWNSRDGVTPFGITSRDGKTELFHVDWRGDRRVSRYLPHEGMRIFVDMTREAFEAIIRRRIELCWNDPNYPMSANWASKEAAFAALAREEYQPGEPDVVVVDAAMRAEMQKKLEADGQAFLIGLPMESKGRLAVKFHVPSGRRP